MLAARDDRATRVYVEATEVTGSGRVGVRGGFGRRHGDSGQARQAGTRQRGAGAEAGRGRRGGRQGEARAGCTPDDEARPDGDAVVSNVAGLLLAVMVADCVPIIVADRTSGAAGAIHAGWRGTSARVGPAALESMRRHFGTEPSDLTVAIGPSIGPDDYEVGEALIEAFQQAGHAASDLARWFRRRDSRLLLDLWAANRDQLIDAGVQADRIFTCGLSTLAHTDVFDSFRSAGERAGRMAAIVAVPL